MTTDRPIVITLRADALRGWQASVEGVSLYGTTKAAAVGAVVLQLLASGRPVLLVRVVESN